MHGIDLGPETAIGLVRPCGTVVFKTTVAAEHGLSLAAIVIDEIQVIGSRCGPFPRAIEALAARAIPVERLIGAEFSLGEGEAGFHAAAARGARKVILQV